MQRSGLKIFISSVLELHCSSVDHLLVELSHIWTGAIHMTGSKLLAGTWLRWREFVVEKQSLTTGCKSVVGLWSAESRGRSVSEHVDSEPQLSILTWLIVMPWNKRPEVCHMSNLTGTLSRVLFDLPRVSAHFLSWAIVFSTKTFQRRLSWLQLCN